MKVKKPATNKKKNKAKKNDEELGEVANDPAFEVFLKAQRNTANKTIWGNDAVAGKPDNIYHIHFKLTNIYVLFI